MPALYKSCWFVFTLIFVSLALFTSFLSCRSVRKTQLVTNQYKDSAATKKLATVLLNKTDSSGKNITSQVNLRDTYSTGDAEFSVSFSDTVASSAPITWRFNGDGTVTLNPGNRKVDNLKGSSKNKTGSRDSSVISAKQISKTAKEDSSSLNKSDSAGQREESNRSISSTKKSQDYTLLIWGIVLLVILAVIYKMRNKIKSIIQLVIKW